MQSQLRQKIPVTCAHLTESIDIRKISALPWSEVDELVRQLQELADGSEIPAYLPDLARAELTRHTLLNRPFHPPAEDRHDRIVINPYLQLLEMGWSALPDLLNGRDVIPEPSPQFLLFWRDPATGNAKETVATPAYLLALKIVTEQLDPVEIAKDNDCPVGVIDHLIKDAIRAGLLLAPQSKLRRETLFASADDGTDLEFRVADVFTLQWHITHRCDLHCRHCYDRSARKDVEPEQGIVILDQTAKFCREHHVAGQVSFSGGNPFLHPDFIDLYRAACERGLTPAILGNPVSAVQLDAVLDIAKPSFFQVSLEGLESHNDAIRGRGNFRSVLGFLDLLRRRQIYSMVMLTLTRDNLDQVLPLAETLRDRTDLFTFNRLAMVGEGARLATPHPGEYHEFVNAYLDARRSNPVLGLKDSLINIELDRRQINQFGGCTGYGCGAAFNFVSLLPDGQVHACRKFPSPIGDINRQTLSEIYRSVAAQTYRQGCQACSDCHLRPVCGGCLAVSYGWGLDPLQDKDPGCFLQ